MHCLIDMHMRRTARDALVCPGIDEDIALILKLPDALRKAYRRVYTPLEPTRDGYWTLLFAPISVVAPSKRTMFRMALPWKGFGMLASGGYASPVVGESVVQEVLRRFRHRDHGVPVRHRPTSLACPASLPMRSATL